MDSSLTNKLPVVVIPIDRIQNIKQVNELIFQEYQGMDLDDYFNQVVGVSINVGAKREKIIIKADFPAAGYIESKPFHNSQIIVEKTNNYIVFELNLITNYEFETQLLGYLDECIIVKPDKLRQKLIERAEKIVSKNK